MSGCGSCSACSNNDKAKEYINCLGRSAVKCPECETEITFETLPENNTITCPDCGAVIEIIRLLLH